MSRREKWTRLYGVPGRFSPEYRAFRAAKQRCMNPRAQHYERYGGRGIRVCNEWLAPDGYVKFFQHVGPRPGPGYSLDRIDNDGNYEPGNVRWATQQAQLRNQRRSVFVEWRGERKTVAEWAERAGMPGNLLSLRLNRGWPMERAMTSTRRSPKP